MLKLNFQKTVYHNFNSPNDEDEFSLTILDDKNEVISKSSALLTLEDITNLAITLTKFEDISTSINFTPEKDED